MTRRDELAAIIRKQIDEALAPYKDAPWHDYSDQLNAVLKHVVEKYKPAERYRVDMTSTPEELEDGILHCTIVDLWWNN